MTDSSSPPRAVPAARRAGLGAPVAATRPLISRSFGEAQRQLDLLAVRLECEELLADDNPLTIREGDA